MDTSNEDKLAQHLIRAITENLNIAVYYQDKRRLVTPYLLAETRDQRLVLQGFQYGGDTSKGPVRSPEDGAWRYFYLDQMHSLAMGLGPGYPQGLQKAETEYKPPDFIVAVLAMKERP